MDDSKTRSESLRQVPFFSGLEDAQLENVARVGRRVSFEPGQPIVEAGQPGDAMYVILYGSAEVEVGGRFHVLGPGDFFGEMALISRKKRQATVRVTERVEALEIRADDFERFLLDNPGIAVAMLKAVVERLREVQDRVDAWYGS